MLSTNNLGAVPKESTGDIENLPIYFGILFLSLLMYIICFPVALNTLIYHRVDQLETITAASMSLTLPITVFLLANISHTLLCTKPKDLPFFVRFVKSKRFWFVVLSIGLGPILLITLLANEKIFKLVYFVLWLDLFVLWTLIAWHILIRSTKMLPDTPL